MHKLRVEAKDSPRKNTPPIAITEKEKAIMDIVYKQIQRSNYIVEKDIEIKGYSKALITRTIRNKDILDVYRLERIRANKEIKRDLKMDIEGYPFILCKK